MLTIDKNYTWVRKDMKLYLLSSTAIVDLDKTNDLAQNALVIICEATKSFIKNRLFSSDPYTQVMDHLAREKEANKQSLPRMPVDWDKVYPRAPILQNPPSYVGTPLPNDITKAPYIVSDNASKFDFDKANRRLDSIGNGNF